MACGSGCCGSQTNQTSAVSPGPISQDTAPQQDLRVSCTRSCDTFIEATPEDGYTTLTMPQQAVQASAAAAPGASADTRPGEKTCCGEAASSVPPGDACLADCCTASGTIRDPENINADCCATTDIAVVKEEADARGFGMVAACQDGCCGNDEPDKAQKKASDTSCQDECCQDGQHEKENSEDPACCRGKPSPCCDASCLDRLVMRECQQDDTCNGESVEHLIV